jgi:Na+-driven multidrug efflux pump
MTKAAEATRFERSEAMEREAISKLLLRFSGPAILAAETSAFYNLFDANWCGRLGVEAVAALSVAHPLMHVYMAVGSRIGVGAASLIARNLGAEKKEEARAALLVPCLLIMPSIFGLAGLWTAYPLADFLSLVLSLSWTITTFRSLGIPFRLRSIQTAL